MSSPNSSPDPRALVERLFLEHMDLIRGFVYGLMPDFARADDVVQETFLTVQRKAEEFQPDTNFPRWACSIARFKVLEMRRASSRVGGELSEEVLASLASSDAAVSSDLRLDYLNECLEQLAPQARRAVRLRYENDHKPAEIARLLSCKPETLYVALSNARSFLRDCVQRKSERFTPAQQ